MKRSINLKWGLIIIISFVNFCFLINQSNAYAKDKLEDVLYLKNGSIVRGTIIEQIPNRSIKIELNNNSIMTFKMKDIKKITKEKVIHLSEDEDVSNNQDNDNLSGNENRSKINDEDNIETTNQIQIFKEKDNINLKSTLNKIGILGFQINPLGFLQFGPIFSTEIKIVGGLVTGPYIRFTGLGLLYHATTEYDEADADAMGIGLATKLFFGNNYTKNRFYVGLLGEYGWGSGNLSDEYQYYNKGYQYTYGSGSGEFEYLAFGLNGGYRWRTSGPLNFSVGIIAGLSFELEDHAHFYYPYGYKSYSDDINFYGMIEFSIGFEFFK